MSETFVDHLKSLHKGAIDARSGYQEALHDAEGRGLTPLFKEMIALHTKNANELSVALTNLGATVDDSGSFMGLIHRTIMSVRSLFNGLDESVLPGLIDGEMRNISYYDEALRLTALPDMTRVLLDHERERLAAAVASMKNRESTVREYSSRQAV